MTATMNLRIGGFIETSATDGPGIRSVLFLQGCHRNCEGCHNKKLQNPNGGVLLSIADTLGYIEKHCKNKKLTISGGEPLEQLHALIELTDLLVKMGFDLCVYTGNNLEDVPLRLRKNLHWLKVGDFRVDYRTLTKPFVGSSNQVMIEINKERGDCHAQT